MSARRRRSGANKNDANSTFLMSPAVAVAVFMFFWCMLTSFPRGARNTCSKGDDSHLLLCVCVHARGNQTGSHAHIVRLDVCVNAQGAVFSLFLHPPAISQCKRSLRAGGRLTTPRVLRMRENCVQNIRIIRFSLLQPPHTPSSLIPQQQNDDVKWAGCNPRRQHVHARQQ